MIDLQALAGRLQEAGLLDTPFRELSREQVLALVRSVVESLQDRRMPYLARDRHGNKSLVVPFDAPPHLQTWRIKDPHQAYVTMHDLLASLGAEDEVMAAYLGPRWQHAAEEQRQLTNQH